MASTDKQYGLIQPKPSKKITVSDVFRLDSDSEPEQGGDWVKKAHQKVADGGLKRHAKIQIQKAIAEDATVYMYDEVYDDMTQKKADVVIGKQKEEKKPKYIQALMQSAERRKKESERRLEREIQKEREAEGDMYKDKEEFITSSYKQKLEEFKQAEEEERKMEYIESVMDVSKQQDLGGFYRHLYKETVTENSAEAQVKMEMPEPEKAEEEAQEAQEAPKKLERNFRKRANSETVEDEPGEGQKKTRSSSSSSDSSSETSSSSDSSDDKMVPEKKEEVKVTSSLVEGDSVDATPTQKAQHEKKESSPSKTGRTNKSDHLAERSESRSGRHDSRDQHSRSYRESERHRRGGSRENRDRDRGRHREDRSRNVRDNRGLDRDRRDRGRDRQNSNLRRRRSRTPERRKDEARKSRERSLEKNRLKKNDNDRSRDLRKSPEKNLKEKEDANGVGHIEQTEKEETGKPLKENKKESNMNALDAKVSIWEKRTVGVVFDAALERYYQRKAARAS